jgi:tRNA modification GTPase
MVLACVEAGNDQSWEATVERIQIDALAPVIVVATKADLVADSHQTSSADIAVSAHSGMGLQELLALIQQRLSEARGVLVLDAPILTRTRHHVAVTSAREELKEFAVVWRDDLLPASVAATHVRAAGEALNELIGDVRVDDVLDVVFKSFCVGK